jgi:hypothetical protein
MASALLAPDRVPFGSLASLGVFRRVDAATDAATMFEIRNMI